MWHTKAFLPLRTLDSTSSTTVEGHFEQQNHRQKDKNAKTWHWIHSEKNPCLRAETRGQNYALFSLNIPAYPDHPTLKLRLHKLQDTEGSSSQAARLWDIQRMPLTWKLETRQQKTQLRESRYYGGEGRKILKIKNKKLSLTYQRNELHLWLKKRMS